jgi:dTDP-4-dehydrorhamnose reductase
VLGKNGQVGQELVRVFDDTRDVTAMGRPELDLANPDAIRTVLRALKPRIVINAAAFTAVDDAELKPAEAMAINRDAPAVIAQEQKAWGGALIHYSTDYVFDGRKSSPYTEADVPAPLNTYGKSKLAGEQAIRDVGSAHLILRASWVYGASAHNFCRTIWRLAGEREELRVVCDQTGSPTWARTIARVTRTLLEKLGDGIHGAREIYHLAAAGQTTRHEFATWIIELLSQRFGAAALRAKRITAVPSAEFQTRATRPRYSVLSSAKLQSEFGIELPRWDEDLAAFIGSTPAHFWQQDPPPA